jgi:hypothetical protein
MKNKQYIGVYCTDTTPYLNPEAIKKFWADKYGTNPGYDFLVLANGKVIPLNFSTGTYSRDINICFVGGRKKDGSVSHTWTQEQQDAIFNKLVELTEKYKHIKIKPDDETSLNHCFTQPSFSIEVWLKIYVPKELRAAGMGFDDLSR